MFLLCSHGCIQEINPIQNCHKGSETMATLGHLVPEQAGLNTSPALQSILDKQTLAIKKRLEVQLYQIPRGPVILDTKKEKCNIFQEVFHNKWSIFYKTLLLNLIRASFKPLENLCEFLQLSKILEIALLFTHYKYPGNTRLKSLSVVSTTFPMLFSILTVKYFSYISE